jgi:hypothetical protein
MAGGGEQGWWWIDWVMVKEAKGGVGTIVVVILGAVVAGGGEQGWW